MEDPVVPLERNLYGHPFAGLLWERQFEKILLKYVWKKVSNWECSFVHSEKGLFLSVYVDDIKLAGKKQNLDPMWKVGARFTRVVHREWSRSTVRHLASALSWLRFVLFFCLVSSFSLFTAYDS